MLLLIIMRHMHIDIQIFPPRYIRYIYIYITDFKILKSFTITLYICTLVDTVAAFTGYTVAALTGYNL